MTECIRKTFHSLVRHNIDEIDVVNGLEIEVPEVPIAGGRCERDDIFDWLLVVLVVELLEKLDKVGTVGLHTTSIISSWVFLGQCQLYVRLERSRLLETHPVKVNSIKCILAEEAHQISDEGRPARLGGHHVAEDFLCWACLGFQ